MKKILCFIFLLTSLSAFKMAAQIINKDTIFLLNEKSQKVYIEPNKNSEHYTFFKTFESEIKTNKKSSKNEKWIPIYSYNGAYYLYVPCDSGYNRRIELTEKKLTVEDFESSTYEIRKINSASKEVFTFLYEDYGGNKAYLEYTIFDKQKGIAIFKFENRYSLMINEKNLKDFPIIVNECKFEKVKEFTFDEPDYKQLLKQIK